MSAPRSLAFVLSICAAIALTIPIYYTFHVMDDFGPYGRAIAYGVIIIAGFGVLTLFASVVGTFILQGRDQRPPS